MEEDPADVGTTTTPMEPCGDKEEPEQDGWCTPPMTVENGEGGTRDSGKRFEFEVRSPVSPTDILDRNLDLPSSTSGRDPKDVYNLIPGEELLKCKENRQPSNGITPPPPSPMHGSNASPHTSAFRVPLKEKSSSVEGKSPSSIRSGHISDESGSASPEPSETSLLQPGPSPNHCTPSSGISAGSNATPPALTTSSSSSDLKKSRSKKSEVDNGSSTPCVVENSAFKRSDSRLSTGASASAGSSVDKKQRKNAWYNRFSASYKTKSESFRRLFNLPSDERLLVDYSCALQRDILLQGRMYISQNYVCFYANIFRWETIVSVRCKDITSVKRERTARVIPNAIQITTESEKYFFTSFATREKTYTMVFRVWQNALMEQPMASQELWNLVHSAYGSELGLTSDDDDYVAPGAADDSQALPPPDFDGRLSDTEPLDPRRLTDQGKDSIDLADEEVSLVEKGRFRKSRMVNGSGDAELGNDEWSPASALGWNPTLASTPDGDVPVKMRKKLVRQRVSEFSDSDSTKSDIESAVITEPVRCTESHDDRVLIDVNLPVSVDQAFTFLFTASEFYLDFLASKKTHDIVLGEWEPGAVKGEKVRATSFKVPVVTPMGPRISIVSQKQRMISCSKPGHLYSINVEVLNGDIPYSESFYIELHFCVSKITATESRLFVSAQIKYRKSVWGFIKGFIEKNTWAGLVDYYDELQRAVIDACTDKRGGLSRTRGSTKSRLRLAKKLPGVPEGILSADESPNFLRKGSVVTGVGPGMAERTIKVSPDAEATMLIARSDSVDETGAPSSSFLRVILLVLVSLLLCNIFLFSRLWALEQSLHVADGIGGAFSGMLLRDLSELPDKPAELVRFIREQEHYHREEVAQWQQVIFSATDLLKQVEKSLSQLQLRLGQQRPDLDSLIQEHTKVTAAASELDRSQEEEVIVENDYD